MDVNDKQLDDILDAHKGMIYKIASVYSQDLEDQKDLEQEIVIQIWKSLQSFKQKSKLSTWIYRVAINVSISHKRKATTRSKINTPIDDVIIKRETTNPVKTKSERAQQLDQFIQRLDKYNKAVIVLYLEGYSYEEIADIIGITKTNVGAKINRIKNKLTQQFKSINTT